MTTAIETPPFRLTQEHESAARGLVRSMQDAFNAKDADALGRNLAEDAVWTNGLGVRAIGRPAIVELARGMLRQFSGRFARYEIANLLPLGDDACIVNVEQIPVDRVGRDTGEMRGAPLFVLGRGADGWKVVAGQNTLVAYSQEEA